ncbi:hypothetical protein RN001_000025 [Aquatica leii]|uniref:Uncharacterized protein n=1 Tax=Aquatica leii TaxID=1421715 RepID=A0AAN7SK94_9COLE|nr:hypothetical protein RN001_000025 [Aquatica leii]
MFAYTFYCALLICCTQVFSIEIPVDLLDKPTLDCLEKINVDKMVFKDFFDEHFHLVRENAKLNEFLECAGTSKNLINEDGRFNHDSIHHHTEIVLIPILNKNGDKHEIATKVTDECINVSGDTYADRITNLHDCIVDALAKH